MSRHHYDHIHGNEDFHTLVASKSKLSWTLTGLMLLVYFSYILTIAFFPEWLGTPLKEGSIISWGIPVGIGIILFTFVITGVYVHKANNLYDDLMLKVIEASNAHVNDMHDRNEKTENGSL